MWFRRRVSPLSLWRFSCRTNTKPKQESYEFKAPQAPPPQPPTQISPQVRRYSWALSSSPTPVQSTTVCPRFPYVRRRISARRNPNIHLFCMPARTNPPTTGPPVTELDACYFPFHLCLPHRRRTRGKSSPRSPEWAAAPAE